MYQGPQTHADDEDFLVQQGVKTRQKKGVKEETSQRRKTKFVSFPISLADLFYSSSLPSP